LKTDTDSPIAGATITFTKSEGRPPIVVFIGTRPPTVVTGNDGSLSAIAGGNEAMKGTTITAHYHHQTHLRHPQSQPKYLEPQRLSR